MKIINFALFIALFLGISFLLIGIVVPDYSISYLQEKLPLILVLYFLSIYLSSCNFICIIQFKLNSITFFYPTRVINRAIVINLDELVDVKYRRIEGYGTSDELYLYTEKKKHTVYIVLNKKKRDFLSEYFNKFKLVYSS